jgi:hypothetical protein
MHGNAMGSAKCWPIQQRDRPKAVSLDRLSVHICRELAALIAMNAITARMPRDSNILVLRDPAREHASTAVQQLHDDKAFNWLKYRAADCSIPRHDKDNAAT